MARRNAARERALQEAKERERAAGKKISRIEARGINIGPRTEKGKVKRSPFDPRVGARNLEGMSTRELREHTKRVDEFVSRRTQFIAAHAGAPVPKSMWEEYRRLEEINNAHADRIDATYGNVQLPGQEQTILGRERMIRPERSDRDRARNQGRIFEHIERPLSSITGAESLERLIDQFRKKARGDYRDDTVQARMNSGEAVLRYSGNADLVEAVRALTAEQKELLIDRSTFFDVALEQFDSPDKSEVSQVMDADYEEHEGVGKNIHVREQLEEQLEWVRTIAPRNPRDKNGRYISREAWAERVAEAQRIAPENPVDEHKQPISREKWVQNHLTKRDKKAR